MRSCPDCGADIRFAKQADGSKVALDAVPQPNGPGRYRLMAGLGEAEAVIDNYPQPAFPLHKNVCPAQDRLGR